MIKVLLFLVLLLGTACVGPSYATVTQACRVALQGARSASDSMLVLDLQALAATETRTCRSWLKGSTP